MPLGESPGRCMALFPVHDLVEANKRLSFPIAALLTVAPGQAPLLHCQLVRHRANGTQSLEHRIFISITSYINAASWYPKAYLWPKGTLFGRLIIQWGRLPTLRYTRRLF